MDIGDIISEGLMVRPTNAPDGICCPCIPRSGRNSRIHDLRHSFASRVLALGEGLTVIGKLLCHAHIETTARYAHLARDSAQEAAERVAASIAEDVL